MCGKILGLRIKGLALNPDWVMLYVSGEGITGTL